MAGGVGCGRETAPFDDGTVIAPNANIPESVIIAKIREAADKPTGALTKADLEKVLWLQLFSYDITDLAPLAGLKKLRWLLLSSNKLTDEQLKHLAGLKDLFFLCLSNNKLTDITPLSELTDLQELNLSGNTVSDLAPLAGLKKLEKLILSYNQITDLTSLTGLARLKELLLFKNPGLTNAKIAQLQNALPRCEIKHDPDK